MTSKQCQAVVVIHGIGEQRPMDTLRGLVDSILGVVPEREPTADRRPAYYSKPDSLSDTFELRRLRTRESRPQTEFFEFYWAHRMPVATWQRILEWSRLLLRRPVKDVPPQFRVIWWALWVTIGVVGVLLLASIIFWLVPAIRPAAWLESAIALPIGVVVLLLVVQAVVLSYVGDAAIYLSPHPRNIEARQAIRSAGVTLLQRLHESGDYDRIIVVGHSLGSVIGYDILTHAWQRFNEVRKQELVTPRRDALQHSERLAQDLRKASGESLKELRPKWTSATRELWHERRELGSTWLVSDFITLGCPLAHADLLLARSHEEFVRKVSQRELPVSPPEPNTDGSFSYSVNYTLPNGSKRDVFILHHAAWLAVVQWTNLYFPCWLFLHGDIVGGPVSPLFGPGVRDVCVKTKSRGGWLAHTRYWHHDDRDKSSETAPIRQLQAALDLRRNVHFKDAAAEATKQGAPS